MKGSVSPAVAAVVIVVLVAVVVVVGYKMFGKSKAADNNDAAFRKQYMENMQNPEKQKAEAMKHMQGGQPGATR